MKRLCTFCTLCCNKEQATEGTKYDGYTGASCSMLQRYLVWNGVRLEGRRRRGRVRGSEA